MCGPMAAAAAATAETSAAFAVNTDMLPPGTHSRVSVRGRSLSVHEVGVGEELDVAGRLPHPRQQHGRVAELLLRVSVDVQDVIPKRVALLRRRHDLARPEIVDRREPLVVERREPGAHLVLVEAPAVHERFRGRVVAERQLPLPHFFGPSLESRAPAPLHVERVDQRPAEIARRQPRRRLELRCGQLRRAFEHAVLHPVAETEERLEILPAHGFERNAMRRGTCQSDGVAGTNVNAGSFGVRRASAAIAMRSRSSSSWTSSPRFIARMYARSSASPSSGRPSSASRAARPRRPESFDTTIRLACQPTDCGVMISYVPGSLSTPSWWMPEEIGRASCRERV